MQKSVSIMVEMNGAPAAATYSAALQTAQKQADAARSYALAHPTLRTSQALLKQKPTAIQISSTAASQVKTKVQQLDQAQKSILSSLTGGNIGGQIIFRAQRAYNGIAMTVSPDKIAAIAALPGVKAIHPLYPKERTAAFSDIDFLNTRPAWTTGPFGTHGENIKVGDIDTGLDYIHKDFGGTGSAADYAATSDTSAVPNTNFPTPKIPGGIDLVGDAYNGSNTPVPDNNPYDCNGHGTATASLITGFGVTNAGFTYSGSYDATNPVMSTLKCAPGFAPNAKLFPIRVFGCAGSTNVVTQAIEFAMDPNGDGNFSDHYDVINMSLGANEGFADDADDVAASNAASIGVVVCSAAGNAGDSYYIHSSPAAAGGTLGCAATFNDQAGFIFDSNVTGNTPPAIAGVKFFSIKGSASSPIPPAGITGNLVYAVPNNGNAAALTNAANINGNIALIDRGVTTFTDKVTKCLNAGAIAVIVDNFTNPGADPILMSTAGQPPGVDVMISRTDRDTINTAAGGFDATTGVPTNPTNVTINNDSGVVSHGGAAPDTMPTYSSRGPRLPDSATKPDISSPAEVVGVAQPFTGNGIENFNGTSSATPHIAGMMALLKQLHPAFSVQELNALACDTANHDLFTTNAHTTQYGVGRVGAGRNDVGNAAAATVVAFNGTDSNLIGVSFGVVEAPVGGTTTLTKNITVENKGATNITYNTSIQNDPALTGATFTVGTANFTVNAGASTTIPVTLTAIGSSLKHAREASVAATQGSPRQWLTEAGGYAVFTPTDASPVLRVELYAAPKPASSMHATTTGVVPTTGANTSGSFTINLGGSSVNTGASLGNGFDIVSLVKAFELQYQSSLVGQPNPPNDRNLIKYAGVTSDYKNRPVGASTTTQTAGTNIMFGVEKWGDAATPDFASSDTEIDFDTNPADVGVTFNPNFAAFLTFVGTGSENVYVPEIVNLNTFAGALRFFTNGLSAATADTNAYNNSGVIFPIRATDIGLLNASGTGNTQFQYVIVTFDRNGNFVDQSNVLFYDLANPGLEVDNSAAVAGVSKVPVGVAPFLEPFLYQDLVTNSIPVTYNGTNFGNNGSLGVWLLHMHNGDGNRSDAVSFLAPTITSFSPTHAKVGAFVTLTGSNYGPGTQVTFFNNVPATTVNVLTANTISVRVPAGAVSGPIRVSNAAGSSSKGGFTVDP